MGLPSTDSYEPTPAAAEYLGLAPSTLNKLRVTGGGPKFIKLGRSVRYRRADLDAWAAARSATSTTDAQRRRLGTLARTAA